MCFIKLSLYKWERSLLLKRKIDLNQKSREGIQDPVTFVCEFVLLQKNVHSDPSEDTRNTQSVPDLHLPPSALHPGMW